MSLLRDPFRIDHGGIGRVSCALFAALFLFHLLGNWSLPLIDRDEPRFAEASREMLEREDWIIPHFNDDYRFDKPPLIYWLQAACYGIFGENEFAARLPSVLATASTGVLIFLFGLGFLNRRHALYAALLFGLCLQTFIHGKAAVADMVMIFFYTASVIIGWALLGDRSRKSLTTALLWILLGVLLGAGFLTKGPVAWLPVITIMLAAIRMKRPPATRLLPLVSLCIAAGIVLLWAYPALARTDGEYFEIGIGKHVVDRSFNVMEGHGIGGLAGYLATAPLYILTIFASFFPGSIWLPWLARGIFERRIASGIHFYLLANFLIVFVVFSFVSTKLPHYILPGFPFLALLLMLHWQHAERQFAPLRNWILRTAGFLALLALVATPFAARYFPSKQLAKMSGPDLQPAMEFASASYEEPSLVWYFRQHVDGFHTKRKIGQVAEYMGRDGPRFAIVPTDALDQIEGYEEGRWITYRVRGINVAKADPVDLTMLIKRVEKE